MTICDPRYMAVTIYGHGHTCLYTNRGVSRGINWKSYLGRETLGTDPEADDGSSVSACGVFEVVIRLRLKARRRPLLKARYRNGFVTDCS